MPNSTLHHEAQLQRHRQHLGVLDPMDELSENVEALKGYAYGME